MNNRPVILRIATGMAIVIGAILALSQVIGGKDDNSNHTPTEISEGDPGIISDEGDNSNGDNTGRTEIADLTIASITLDPPFPQAGASFRLEVIIENIGATQADDYSVYIELVDTRRGTVIQSANPNGNKLAPGAQEPVIASNNWRAPMDSSYKIEVRITPSGTDANAHNNTKMKCFDTGNVPSGTPIPCCTCTPTPTVTLTSPATKISMVVTATPETIIDISGELLGNGTFRLYAPKSVKPGGTARIRLEINVNAEAVAALSTPSIFSTSPSATQTPPFESGDMQPTLPPMVGFGPIPDIHRNMGAEIQGAAQFTIFDIHPDPIRHISENETAWWEWLLFPNEDTAVGTHHLQVYIYLPRIRESGGRDDVEVERINFQLRVKGESKSTWNQFTDFITHPVLLALITIIGGIAAIVEILAWWSNRQKEE